MRTGRVSVVDGSIELLADEEIGPDEADDEEAALDELIDALVHPPPEGVMAPVPVREGEFVCSSCHLIQHHSRLADFGALLCRDCVRTSRARRERRGRGGASPSGRSA